MIRFTRKLMVTQLEKSLTIVCKLIKTWGPYKVYKMVTILNPKLWIFETFETYGSQGNKKPG